MDVEETKLGKKKSVIGETPKVATKKLQYEKPEIMPDPDSKPADLALRCGCAPSPCT